MVLSKYKFYITFLSIAIFLFAFGLLSGRVLNNQTTEYIYQQADRQLQTVASGNSKFPLPVPSSITTEKNGIRLDLEKIAVNKYFIVYSTIYGNQSHTAYHLYLTDLNRKNLDKDRIADIYLKTASGEIIKPVAQQAIIRDFPKDQPLGWKIKIIVKFPYQSQRQTHSLILNYQGQEFVLSGIEY